MRRKKLLESESFRVGSRFVGRVLSKREELDKLVKGLCKPCRKIAKKSVRRKNFKGEPCVDCKPLLDEAVRIAGSMNLEELVK